MKNFDIPSELIEKRANCLGTQRNKILNDHLADWFNDLADWFNAERQIRQEMSNKEP